MRVQIWVAWFPSNVEFELYVQERPEYWSDPDEAEPLNRFIGDQGGTFYDHDYFMAGYYESPIEADEVGEALNVADEVVDEVRRAMAALRFPRPPNCLISIGDDECEEPRDIRSDRYDVTYVGSFEYKVGPPPRVGSAELYELEDEPVFLFEIGYDGVAFGCGGAASVERPYCDLGPKGGEAGVHPTQALIRRDESNDWWIRGRDDNELTRVNSRSVGSEEQRLLQGSVIVVGPVRYLFKLING